MGKNKIIEDINFGTRTSPKKKAKELAKYLRGERPDYDYLKSIFRELRSELEIEVPKSNKKLPYVPTEDELKRFYDEAWESKKVPGCFDYKDFLLYRC